MKKKADNSGKKITPMLRQYLEIKQAHPDKILFYRMGDFYEMFFDDAVLAARLLKITLTSRNKKDEEPIPMCGIPHHAAEEYLATLIAAGRKVAICDQVEDPKTAKGLVKRAVTRIVTPGVTFAESTLDTNRKNFLAAVSREGKIYGLAFLEATTGEFKVTETAKVAELRDELAKNNPRELLLDDETAESWQEDIRAEFPALHFTRWAMATGSRIDRERERLCRHFAVLTLDGFGAGELTAGLAAAGAALAYLEETQVDTPLEHINRLQVYQVSAYMRLDRNTLANLEVLQTLQEQRKAGSLFGLLDHCRTAMGSRLLKQWLTYPLVEREQIERRLDAVQVLVGDQGRLQELQEALDRVYDLERLAGKLASRKANGRDLLCLKDSLMAIPLIKRILASLAEPPPLMAETGAALNDLASLVASIENTLLPEQPPGIREGNLIRPGVSPELDELQALRRQGRDWILALEQQEKERTGISGLKIRYNRVFGYYIEVTHRNRELVPADYLRKQTLTNADRYITPQLKEYEEKIIGAEEKIIAREYELFCRLRETAAASVAAIQENAARLATLDTLASLAKIAVLQDFCRPRLDAQKQELQITDGRHPIVEALNQQERFVPNDCHLHEEREQIWIITGPNMAGKSTFLRQNGVIALLAQAGSFVPATSARLPIFDQIFTRVGAADNLSRGLSTFMVEMTETAQIINRATRKSLLILDEIGRGTSTFDGVSIAWAVAEHIHDHSGSLTLFATHYHELTELSLIKERIKNYNVAVKQEGEKITFLRQIMPGSTNRSYGIEVARLAGLPAALISRAREILHNLEQAEFSPEGRPLLAGSQEKTDATERRPGYLPMLEPFTADVSLELEALEQARRLLRKTDINRTTPLRALIILDKLKQLL